MTYIHNNREYEVVKAYDADEIIAYREIGNNHIELLSMFAGLVRTAEFHVDTVKKVLAHREYMQEVKAQEETRIMKFELEREIERRASA